MIAIFSPWAPPGSIVRIHILSLFSRPPLANENVGSGAVWFSRAAGRRLRLSSRASLLCAARDLGAPIRAGARKARILIQNSNCTTTKMSAFSSRRPVRERSSARYFACRQSLLGSVTQADESEADDNVAFFSLAIPECWFTIGILTGAFGLVVGMAWRSRDEVHSYKVGSVCGTRSPGDLPRLWGRFNDFVPAGNRPFTTAAATAAAHRHAIPEPERSASGGQRDCCLNKRSTGNRGDGPCRPAVGGVSEDGRANDGRGQLQCRGQRQRTRDCTGKDRRLLQQRSGSIVIAHRALH